jgi:acetyl-CoA carboxylase biotin carboxyl carrier protein
VSDTAVNGRSPADADIAGHDTDAAGPDAAGHAVTDLVTLLTERALALSVQAPWAPSSVRISADAVEVEIRWPAGPAAAPGVPVTAPAPAAGGQGVGGQGAGRQDEGAADRGQPETFPLCAGTVGTFYRAPEPGAAPFVTEGDQVRPGQQVGIIEAMKLMIPVEADLSGQVTEFLVADRAPVEYGQPLMLLREAGQ